MSKKICFIINPKSGTGNWKGVEKSIQCYLDKSFTHSIQHTERAGHATELAREAAKTNDVIVAVGGDGMMNETACGIIGTSVLLGIIPTGSGNALARHLGIPLSHKGAMECINTLHNEAIDMATLNEKPFFALAGAGYDAEIATRFAKSNTRGFFTYLQLSVAGFFAYKPVEYIICIDGQDYYEKAFLISIANAAQYGNNAYISPTSSVQDGVLEVCVLKSFPIFAAPFLAIRLFTKTINRSPYLKTLHGKYIEIKKADNTPFCIHYDGETMPACSEIKVTIKPHAIKVIIPEGKTYGYSPKNRSGHYGDSWRKSQ